MKDFRKTTIAFSFIFIGFVVCMMLCGRCNPNENGLASQQTEETSEEDTIIDAPQIDDEIDLGVRPPYYYDSTASCIPCMYGMIKQHDRVDHLDKSYFPPIPDLYFKSCMESCKGDYCKSKRAVLAISCPKNPQLLRWVSNTVCNFTNACMEDSLKSISPNLSLKSAKEICDYYIEVARRSFKQEVSVCDHEANLPLEQHGWMIADVWQKGHLHTFLVSSWYDWNSCGDNTAFAYVTVDASTGKGLTYEDFINQSDEKKMEDVLQQYLHNGNGRWAREESNKSLLSQMDGCALLKEGLIIYYYPYTIGSGADGEFIAIIPYEVLEANSIKLKTSQRK